MKKKDLKTIIKVLKEENDQLRKNINDQKSKYLDTLIKLLEVKHAQNSQNNNSRSSENPWPIKGPEMD